MNPYHTAPGGITVPANVPMTASLITGLAAQRDALEAQLERYRNIITTLEAELAETTDKWHGLSALHWEQRTASEAHRNRADIAETTAEALRAEVAALRAEVAELTRLNTEGRPWQITRAEAGA